MEVRRARRRGRGRRGGGGTGPGSRGGHGGRDGEDGGDSGDVGGDGQQTGFAGGAAAAAAAAAPAAAAGEAPATLSRAARFSASVPRAALAAYAVALPRFSALYLEYECGLPFLEDVRELEGDLSRVQQRMAERSRGFKHPREFLVAWTFSPVLVEAVCYSGLFPMSLLVDGEFVMAPKLHRERCVLLIPELHVERVALRRARQLSVSVNRAFDRVVAGCVRRHGDNWLCPQLRRAFFHLFAHRELSRAKLFSFEVWSADGALVAGELGYAVGTVYASLTGYTDVSGAGTVQLLATGMLLRRAGFALWDFGMEMRYKTTLGTRLVPRPLWLRLHHSLRDKPAPTLECPQPVSAAAVVRAAGGDSASLLLLSSSSLSASSSSAAAAAAAPPPPSAAAAAASGSRGGRRERPPAGGVRAQTGPDPQVHKLDVLVRDALTQTSFASQLPTLADLHVSVRRNPTALADRRGIFSCNAALVVSAFLLRQRQHSEQSSSAHPDARALRVSVAAEIARLLAASPALRALSLAVRVDDESAFLNFLNFPPPAPPPDGDGRSAGVPTLDTQTPLV